MGYSTLYINHFSRRLSPFFKLKEGQSTGCEGLIWQRCVKIEFPHQIFQGFMSPYTNHKMTFGTSKKKYKNDLIYAKVDPDVGDLGKCSR